MSPKSMTTAEKLEEGMRLLDEAADELAGRHPLGLFGTRMRVGEALATLATDAPAEDATIDEPEVTVDG